MADRPTLIPGFPHLLHGGDYNPDQWLHRPDVLDADLDLMAQAGCNVFSVGIFAWSRYEPTEGQFEFDWMDRLLDRFAERGLKAILATPSGARPPWMGKHHPETNRVGRNGLRHPYNERHNHCPGSPYFRQKVADMNTRLAERYARHPALGMWHLSNEYSGDCFCEHCLARWHGWLERKYGTLEALNDAWWTSFWSHRYADWSEVEPRDGCVDGMSLDWMRFVTWSTCDFIELEKAPLRAANPDVPITTNFMGTFDGLNYDALAQHLDLIADDQYPLIHPEDPNLVATLAAVGFKDDLHRGMKPDRPWMLMESCPDSVQWRTPMRLKRPGIHRMEMLQAVAHGAEGTCYFQWRKGQGAHEKLHGAVVDHVGHANTRVFRDVAALGEAYRPLADVIGSEVRSDVAILYDWEAKWGYNFTSGMDPVRMPYDRVAMDHYRAFFEMGMNVDVRNPLADLGGYRLVIAPTLWLLREGVAERLRAYVEGGGCLVATPYFGWADRHNRMQLGGWPGEGLREVFGVWNEENDGPPYAGTRGIRPAAGSWLAGAGTLTSAGVASILHAEGATVLATYADDFYAGTPAITDHTFGRGRAIFLGPEFGTEALAAIYPRLVDHLGLPRISDLPTGLLLRSRRSEDQKFFFFTNPTAEPKTVAMSEPWRDAETGAPLERLTVEPWAVKVAVRPIV